MVAKLKVPLNRNLLVVQKLLPRCRQILYSQRFQYVIANIHISNETAHVLLCVAIIVQTFVFDARKCIILQQVLVRHVRSFCSRFVFSKLRGKYFVATITQPCFKLSQINYQFTYENVFTLSKHLIFHFLQKEKSKSFPR